MSPGSRSSLALAATLLCSVTLLPGAAHAAGTWSAPVAVSTSGSVSYPVTVAGAGGTATAIWIQSGGTNPGVITARRGTDGQWGAATRLSDPATSALSTRNYAPQLVLEASGAVTAIWLERVTLEAGARVRTARQTVQGGWSAAQTLAEQGAGPSLTVDPAGQVVAAWTDDEGSRVRTRTTSGVWGDPQPVAETTEWDYYIDTDHYYGDRTVHATKLVTCNGRVYGVWTASGSSSYSGQGAGGSYSYPSLVFAKELPTSGGAWPAIADGTERTGAASGSGVGNIVCGPAGELTVAAVGNYENGDKGGAGGLYRFASVTKAPGGAWGSLDVHAESGQDWPALLTSRHFAYTPDGTLLRAVEKDQQVTLASKPRGGAWTAAAPLLPATSPTKNPFFYVDPAGAQLLFYGRDGDVPARAEVRERASTGGAWGTPVTISTPGATVGGVQASGHADGTITALTIERTGTAWRLTSSSFKPDPITPVRIPVKLSGATLTFDVDLTRSGTTCPAAGALWVAPVNTVNGVKTNVPVASRALTIKAGAGNTCTITGTATLSRVPSRTGLTVAIGGTGLIYRAFVPA